MKNNYLLTIVIALIVGGIGFYGGMKYQQSQRGNFSGQFGSGQSGNGQFVRNGQGTRVNNSGGFRPVNGDIISADDKSITVKLQDGSSKIVILSDKTQINKAETVNKSELKTGVKVAVFGTENPDGTVTAQNVQVNPVLRNMPQGQ